MRILNFNVIVVSVANRIDHELYEKFSKTVGYWYSHLLKIITI